MSEKETGKCEDGLDWEELEPEIKGLLRERNRWRGRKVFLVTFVISSLPTFFNIGLNIWSVINFFNGTTYTKYASNITHSHNHTLDFDFPFTHSQSHRHVEEFKDDISAIVSHNHFHPSVDNDLCTNGFQINYRLDNYTLGIKNWCRHCTPVQDTVSNNSSHWQFECFEQDRVWGFATLVTMFLPGAFGLQQIAEGKGDLFNAVVVLTFPFFPLVLVAMKILVLFNPGPNWKIFADRFGLLEGRLGCQYQLGLQLFILFIRADRSPSIVQLMTIATSLLMMAKAEIDDELMKQPSSEDKLKKQSPSDNELKKQHPNEDELKKEPPSDDEVTKQSPSEDRLWRLLRAANPVPRVLANGILISCIFALLATLLRSWSLLWILVWPAFNRFSDKMLLPALRSWNQPEEAKLIVEESEEKERSILIAIKNKIGFALLLVLLTGFVVAANKAPHLKMPGLWLFYETWIVWKVCDSVKE